MLCGFLPHGVALSPQRGAERRRHACRRSGSVVARLVRPDIGYRQQQWQIKTAFLTVCSQLWVQSEEKKSGHSSAPQYTSKFHPHEGAPSWLSLGDGSTQHCRPGTLKGKRSVFVAQSNCWEHSCSCAQRTTSSPPNRLFSVLTR